MPGQLYKLQNAYRLLRKQAGHVVLATIVETMGSTYQKPGARMLIAEDGELTGLLGGGCFEPDLLEQAKPLFQHGQARTVFYDMRSPDDEIWGLGLGCNGAVRILLQLLRAEDDFYPLNLIARIDDKDDTAMLASVCSSEIPAYPTGHSVFLHAVKRDGGYAVRTADPVHEAAARQVLSQNQSGLIEQDIGGNKVTIFYDLLRPPARLLLIGAGADALPLTQLAKLLGWHITVIDYREGYIKPERFPEADRLLHITADALDKRLPLEQFDALVILTHNIKHDERYLNIIADSNVPYIGLLGPPQRRDRLLDSLGERAEKICQRIFGPAGLDIGANTPEEIALSIMAEIQAATGQGQGGSLRAQSIPPANRQ